MLRLGTSQIMSIVCVVAGVGVIVALLDRGDSTGAGAGAPSAGAPSPIARPGSPFKTLPQSAAPSSVVKTVTENDKSAGTNGQPDVAATPRPSDGESVTDPRLALSLKRMRAIQEKSKAEGKRVFSRVNPLLRAHPGIFDAPPPEKTRRPAGTRDGAQKSSDKLSRISSEEPETTDPILQVRPATTPGGVKLTTGSVSPQRSAAVTPDDEEADTPSAAARAAKPARAIPKARKRKTRRARSRRRSRRARRESRRRKYRYNPAVGRPKAWDLP